MRGSIATVGSLLILLSTIFWATMVERAGEVRITTDLQLRSAVKVARLWELEAVSVAYRALQRLDEYLRAHSGGEMINTVLSGALLLKPYSRHENGGVLIELREARVAFHPVNAEYQLLSVDERLRTLGLELRGTILYLFIHLRVTDQWTGVSKEAGGWIRLGHPARLALVQRVCEEAEEAARQQLQGTGTLREGAWEVEGLEVRVTITRAGSRLSVQIRVLERGVLGVLDGLNQDLVCVRSFLVDQPG
jgi:hypothetical protein